MMSFPVVLCCDQGIPLRKCGAEGDANFSVFRLIPISAGMMRKNDGIAVRMASFSLQTTMEKQ
jgi:hypothetical protein